MKADAQTTSEVESALQHMVNAYKNRDLQEVMDCFSHDDDVMLYGTGIDEKRIGIEQIQTQVERDWEQTESLEMTFSNTSISSTGTVAWASADGEFNINAGGQTMSIPARASFVMDKRDGKWLIDQAHFSTPATGQEEGSSI